MFSKNQCLILWIPIILFGLTGGTFSPAQASSPSLTLAVIPVIDTLPMFVAQAEGLYAKRGVEVKLLPVASAPERDQLLQAGQADGTLNEILSVMFFNRQKIRMQAVRYGLMASKGAGHFFLLTAPSSGIAKVQDLKGVEIGIAPGTIIEYIGDRLLSAHGLRPQEIRYAAVPKIPDRMALLTSGKLKAAILPDPLAGLAVQQGAKILLDDQAHPQWGASVISFLKETIDRKPMAVKAFLAAVEDAVALINAFPARYKNLLAEKKIVPAPLIGNYVIPPFPGRGVTSEEEWKEVSEWAVKKGLLSAPVSYAESVNPKLWP